MARASALIEQRVTAVITPLLESQGYELVCAEYDLRAHILRLYIDRSGGITLDHCSAVAQLVGDVLDGEGLSELIEGKYTLEVSSPGLDRPLVKAQDFERFVGRQVRVTALQAVPSVAASGSPPSLKDSARAGGRRNFVGLLSKADPLGIELIVDKQTYVLSYDNIERARLVPEF